MTWEWFSCFSCGQGKLQVNVPSNYDGKPPLRTFCKKEKCQAYKKFLEGEEARNQKIKSLEEELVNSQAETEKIRKQIEENERKINKSSPPGSPSQEPNEEDLNCSFCHKYIKDKYYELVGSPKLTICETCRPRAVANQVVTEYIMQGQNINVENIEYLAPEDKICLKSLQKIYQRENIDVDGLPIDDLSKQTLKVIQQQIPPQQTNLPDLKTNFICANCYKEFPSSQKKGENYLCSHCQTKSNQPTNTQNKKSDNIFDSPAFWTIFLIILVAFAILYFIWREKKIKSMKKAGKKIPWWY